MNTRHFIVIILAGIGLSGCAASSPRGADRMEAAAAGGSDLTGRPAPEFSLLDQEDQLTALSDYRGRWLILYFYPKDDTPGCTCQATEFTSLLRRFNDMNATVVGVSPDTPGDHRFFIRKYDLKFTLLSDVEKNVMRRYGAWVDMPEVAAGAGRIIRSTFLIDPGGRIAYHWPEVIPQGHAERVREKLAELQGAG